MAMGVPLGLAIAMSARTAAARAAALAAVPVLVLTGFFTISRGGILAVGVGLLVALALTPDRGRWLGKLSLVAAGSAILVKGALQREELRDGVRQRAGAATRATSCWSSCSSSSLGIVLVHVGASLARAAQLAPSLPADAPVQRRLAWGAVVVALVAGATVFAASGALADRWQEFKAPPTAATANDVHRLGTFTGESRYQVWVSALDAFKSAPVAGIGAGSFDNWWERHATTRESLRNAHSLYAETLGELGLVGMHAAARTDRAHHRRGRARRPAYDRAASGAARRSDRGVRRVRRRGRRRLALAGHGAADLLPAARRGRTAAARAGPRRARRAAGGAPRSSPSPSSLSRGSASRSPARRNCDPASRRPRPTSSIPRCARRAPHRASNPSRPRRCCSAHWSWSCEATCPAAASAARAAERKEPTNWRPPFVLARIETERGDVSAGLAALRRAQALNKTAAFLR